MITSTGRASSEDRPTAEGRGRTEEARDPIGSLAAGAFGISYLYPIQRFVISNILEGIDQIVILPTGAGKSLCFQAPSLLLPGPTLVVMPLLSLLADQMRKLEDRGAPAAAFTGGMTDGERTALFSRIESGAVKLVLATPEACLTQAAEKRLSACRFRHFVVDEAHCVSEWGESFRPAYLGLGGLAARIGAGIITAFTATASPAVIEKIRCNLFAERDARVVAADADRPNISYAVVPALSRMRALSVLTAESESPLLVFCRTRKGSEMAARTLRRRGADREIRFYHAGLSKAERASIEAWFLSSRTGALFATSAYGMGVDKPDIRTVIHADVPPSIESYLQETGRAGRDGGPSRAILVVSPGDGAFVSALAPGREKDRYAAMMEYALSRASCRRGRLLSLIGQEPPACSGCDVCGGAVREAEGRAEILSFIARRKRAFPRAQAEDILSGALNPRVIRYGMDRVMGYGTLRSWDKEDVIEAFDALLAEGALRLLAWPWKGRLTAGRRPGAPPTFF